MELIYHTADTEKNLLSLVKLFDSDLETIELDFVLSKDGVPVWTHDIYPTTFQDSTSDSLKDCFTIYDVLNLNDKHHKLMLDFKYIPKKYLNSDSFNKLLQHLNNYDISGGMQIHTLDLAFLEKLANGIHPNLEPGLIINFLSKGFINNLHIPRIPNIEFMSISSELWERYNGSYIKKCDSLYPNIKKYAWTWDTRIEDEDRINNFINKGADGIITGSPNLVKRLIKKN